MTASATDADEVPDDEVAARTTTPRGTTRRTVTADQGTQGDEQAPIS